MSDIDQIADRLQEMEDRQAGQWAEISGLKRTLEPVTRQQAREGLVKALEGEGKVVKDKKPARRSGTVQASIAGAAGAVYAAWELFPGAMITGEWDTFGAAAGAAATALVALWRRYKVGDLEIMR